MTDKERRKSPIFKTSSPTIDKETPARVVPQFARLRSVSLGEELIKEQRKKKKNKKNKEEKKDTQEPKVCTYITSPFILSFTRKP
jgi:hypothetical protein